MEQKAQLGKLVAELSDLIALRNGEMLSQYEREQLIENKRRRITSILAEQQQQRATLLEETRRSSGGKNGALDQSACKQGESVSQNEGLLSTAPLFLAFSENHPPCTALWQADVRGWSCMSASSHGTRRCALQQKNVPR